MEIKVIKNKLLDKFNSLEDFVEEWNDKGLNEKLEIYFYEDVEEWVGQYLESYTGGDFSRCLDALDTLRYNSTFWEEYSNGRIDGNDVDISYDISNSDYVAEINGGSINFLSNSYWADQLADILKEVMEDEELNTFLTIEEEE